MEDRILLAHTHSRKQIMVQGNEVGIDMLKELLIPIHEVSSIGIYSAEPLAVNRKLLWRVSYTGLLELREAALQEKEHLPTIANQKRVAEAIWNASRADEGSISVMGADIVSAALFAPGGPLAPRRASELLVNLSLWIDAGNMHRDPEARAWGRLAKIGEEGGEVIEAFIGYTGQNPRKGVNKTLEDVNKELMDTAITALGAWEHLNGHPGLALEVLEEAIERVALRAQEMEPALGNPGYGPEDSDLEEVAEHEPQCGALGESSRSSTTYVCTFPPGHAGRKHSWDRP